MSRGKSCGAVFTLVGIVLVVYLFSEYSGLAWSLVGIFVVLAIIAAVTSGPSSCQVCGVALKKTRYTWNINDKKTVVCPACNRRLSDRMSKDAVDRILK